MIEFGKRLQVTTPSGVISDAGIVAIGELIDAENPLQIETWKALNPAYTANYIPRLPADWQWEWIVSKGVYAGTLPKRVARFYFKVHNLKCPPTFLERLGNVARQHTSEGETYEFDFTQALTWSAGDFGDAGSCYWGGHADAREWLMDDGAFAIRFYRGDQGYGRAWIVDRMDGDRVFVLFNGYGLGSTPTLTAARIFSLHLGLTYKRVSLSNHDQTTGTVYINGGSGYLIGAVDVVSDYHSYDLQVGEESECCTCDNCGREISEDDSYTTPDGDTYCERCYDEYYRTCEECGETYHVEDMNYIDTVSRDVCDHCRDQHYSTCDRCEDYYHNDDLIAVEEGEDTHYYCPDCKRLVDEEAEQAQPPQE